MILLPPIDKMGYLLHQAIAWMTATVGVTPMVLMALGAAAVWLAKLASTHAHGPFGLAADWLAGYRRFRRECKAPGDDHTS